MFLRFRPFNWKILVKSINSRVWSPKTKAIRTFMNVVIWQKKYIYCWYIRAGDISHSIFWAWKFIISWQNFFTINPELKFIAEHFEIFLDQNCEKLTKLFFCMMMVKWFYSSINTAITSKFEWSLDWKTLSEAMMIQVIFQYLPNSL